MFLYTKKLSFATQFEHSKKKKKLFQITLKKGHHHTKGWHNVCICFIWLVVHQYKNIKK